MAQDALRLGHPSMRLLHGAFIPLLLVAGCAAIAPEPTVAPKPEAVAPHRATPPYATKPTTALPPPAVPAATPATATKPPAAPASAGAKPLPPPTAAISASAASAPVAPPTLDLAALKEQLKETQAIGVFTKLTLKNQVDDLLEQFRDYYQGKAKITMAQLRRSYDVLLMKVLSLLQDSDQKLAAAVATSREAIWALLADPKKFAALKG